MYAPSTDHTLHNLKAYRRACDLADDVFWMTRRFPPPAQARLIRELRHAADAISVEVEKAWEHLEHRPTYELHLDGAQSACAYLGLWLNFSLEAKYLTLDQYETLLHRNHALQQAVNQLRVRRRLLLY